MILIIHAIAGSNAGEHNLLCLLNGNGDYCKGVEQDDDKKVTNLRIIINTHYHKRNNKLLNHQMHYWTHSMMIVIRLIFILSVKKKNKKNIAIHLIVFTDIFKKKIPAFRLFQEGEHSVS